MSKAAERLVSNSTITQKESKRSEENFCRDL
jgi:hypothetical protein